MFKILKEYFFKPLVILIALFTIGKVLFLFNAKSLLKNVSFKEITQVFTNSLSIDWSVCSYILLVSCLVLLLQFIFYKRNFIYTFTIVYFTFISFLIAFFIFLDLQLFHYWNARFNARALIFLDAPVMIVKSGGVLHVVTMFLIILMTGYLAYNILAKWIKKIELPEKKISTKLITILLLFGLFILGLRGGFREIPINQSDAYFSDNMVLNMTGVNPLWNAGNVFFQNQKSLKENPYKTMPQEKADAIFEYMMKQEKDTSVSILNIDRPNIIYLALEGVNANCLRNINANNNYMPNLGAIANEGILFTNMYASGQRTDQGLVTLISGFPAMPLHTIGAQPEKFQNLPSLSKALKELAYTNTFYFGGEPEFGSFKAFLVHNGFTKIFGYKDFNKKQLTQELGAPDADLFNKHIEAKDYFKEPFFHLILTQSTHEPFDLPINEHVNDDVQRYVNSAIYTDSCIGFWYNIIKKEPWFKNTLLIISSDHAHTFPGKYWYTDKERYHIPFIVLGGALKDSFRNTSNTKICNQADIPLSLSNQLNMQPQFFKYSKDLWNPYTPEFSTFIHIHGHNYLDKISQCSVDYSIKNDFSNSNDSCLLKNAVFFQVVFQDYMEK